jgi:predicted aspartyl protease
MNPSNHTRFEREKQAYWRMRDQLLQQHFGKWVAIVNGKILAVGEKKMTVLREAFARTHSEVGYINRVGYEETTKRKSIRQIVSGRYDMEYDPPIPMAQITFLNPVSNIAKPVDCIVDTGADLTVLHGQVADELGIWNYEWDEAEVSGIGAQPQKRTLYLTTVQMAGQEFPITVDCRRDFNEDILGRDIINEFELTVSSKRDLVSFQFVADEV